METVAAATAILAELLPLVTKLVAVILSPVYDAQAERDVIFEIQNTVARERLKRQLAETPVVGT